MRIYTIGFARKSAERFFEPLVANGVRQLVDIRLHNTSQLAGFTKRDDLAYFLRRIGSIDYLHLPSLAPTDALLDGLKKLKGSWSEYETGFLDLMRERQAIERLDRSKFKEPICLLCSEATPEHCHRRLVADLMRAAWGEVEIRHL